MPAAMDRLDTYQPLNVEPSSTGACNKHITSRAPSPKYQDVAFAIAFVANFIVLVGLCFAYHRVLDDHGGAEGGMVHVHDGNKYIDKPVFDGVLVAGGIAVGFAVAWYFMIRTFAKQLIWAGIILTVVVLGVGALAALIAGNMVVALVLLAFCGIQILYCWCVRNRIALAATMTEIAAEVGGHFPGMFAVAGAWIGVNLVTLFVWLLSAYYTLYHLNNIEKASGGAMYGAGCYFVLSLYWIAYVNIYVVHCTAAGVFGHWYFQVHEDNPSTLDTAPTTPALKRATSTSFGSVCFGALVIAVIELMNAMARQAQRDSNNAAAAFVACCMRLILECIGEIVKFVNRYAFTICAIYGDSYCEGVKMTMDVLQQNGFEAIINDDLVTTCLGMGAFLGGLTSAGLGALVAHADGADAEQLIVVFIAGLLIGLSIIGVVCSSVVSCVSSFWVCFALDPTVLFQTKPSQYGKVASALAERWGGETEVPCYEYMNGSSDQAPAAAAVIPPGQEFHSPPEYKHVEDNV
eukprot:TRINITY_DN1053_c0_g3_i2.p1 TRINITY_DN1053_c0_g3~~TRINITY_DN1053_c0_g3_i2.p1  ORF type:complete len:519 (+),score=97.68 TRINITY_DN1053_c0_g3_i2:181-1737(+)